MRSHLLHRVPDGLGLVIAADASSLTLRASDQEGALLAEIELVLRGGLGSWRVPLRASTTSCTIRSVTAGAVRDVATYELARSPTAESAVLAVVGHTAGSRGVMHQRPELLVGALEDLRPEAVIHTGDLVAYPTPERLRIDFLDLFEGLLRDTPVLAAAGNHDLTSRAKGADGSELIALLPYPWDAEMRERAIPFHRATFGSLELFFLGYYPWNQLELDHPQISHLRSKLESSRAPFKIVVLGGASVTSPHPARETLLSALPEWGVDAAIMGDGEGFDMRRDARGLLRLFNGCSDSRGEQARPYTVIEVGAFELTFNAFSLSGAHLGSQALRDTSPERPREDLLPAFAGGSARPADVRSAAMDAERGGASDVTPPAAALTFDLDGDLTVASAPMALDVRDARGVLVRTAMAPLGARVAGHYGTATWLRWLIVDESGERLVTPQPFSIGMGRDETHKLPIPDLARRAGARVESLTLHFGLSLPAGAGGVHVSIQDLYVF